MTEKKKIVIRQSLLLLFAAAIWGTAFVAQSVGNEYVETFTFNCIRNLIGSIVLLPVILFLRKREFKNKDIPVKSQIASCKMLWFGGVCCGVVLFVASNLQQYAIGFTSVGKAGFITALYIVIVPILGMILKKPAGTKIWFSVLLSVAGLYLLCMKEKFGMGKGEWLLLLGSVLFAVHILVIDYFVTFNNGVKMACIQFLTCGILSGIFMLLLEKPSWSAICSAAIPILYAGIMSCGVAYTLQIVGQKGMNPTICSLLLSMESVFSVLAGFLILGQALSIRELIGCMIMFVAIILAQLSV